MGGKAWDAKSGPSFTRGFPGPLLRPYFFWGGERGRGISDKAEVPLELQDPLGDPEWSLQMPRCWAVWVLVLNVPVLGGRWCGQGWLRTSGFLFPILGRQC